MQNSTPETEQEQNGSREDEEWDEEEQYEEDDDEDIDAEAQEIARRLGEQLWADINMVNAERNGATAAPTTGNDVPAPPATTNAPEHMHQATSMTAPTRKEDAIIETIKTILMILDKDPLAKHMLFSTPVHGATNVLNVLQASVAMNRIDKAIAAPLSQIMVTLARSDALFGSLRNSDAAAAQLDKGKRKREELDEGAHLHHHAFKRVYVPNDDLQNQMFEAVRVISQALGASPPPPIDPALISSIRLHLHQIFIFAVTSSAVRGPHTHALQEISGLIQVIGVLSGIQIGQPADNLPPPNPTLGWHPGPPHPQTNIGTAVYPCLVAGCHKNFSRLYGLRAHQRGHASHRPFRCALCPASFARNHDLKRHLRLHDKKAWRCEGCTKIFSRRDAIKRHKNGLKNKGPRSEICLSAEVTEVQLDEEDGEDLIREERRAKLWNGISLNEANQAAVSNAQAFTHIMEEGEINPHVINSIQVAVLGLHGLLQNFVSSALGSPPGQMVLPPPDPNTGQTTLASVIARVQGRNLPPGPPFPSSSDIVPSPHHAEEHTMEMHGESPQFQAPPTGENPENQPLPSLSMYGLSDEQAHLLEIAIANAASAAQAQAEAEAALEEEDDEEDDEEEEEEEVTEETQNAPK